MKGSIWKMRSWRGRDPNAQRMHLTPHYSETSPQTSTLKMAATLCQFPVQKTLISSQFLFEVLPLEANH